jgi:menaquinone-9 beta-reductase
VSVRPDILVVGGGPAGLATAIAAARRGFRVAVVDGRTPPIDKACGEGLLPDAVAALGGIGVELDSSIAFPFTGMRFTDEASSASAKIARGKAFGLRRTVLHQILIQRAEGAGVTFFWGARISGFDLRGVCVNGEFLRYKWLVGADGWNSMVRRSAGLDSRRPRRSRFAFRRHFAIRPWTDEVEVHWGERCEMIITPTGAEEICVAVFSSDPQMRIERALARFPEIAGRLARARPLSAEAGAVTSLGRARSVARGNVALVGDASCTLDGIAGQGLSLALQEAGPLAEAFAREDLGFYEAAHRKITRVPARMTQLLLWMDANVWLRRKVLRLFASKPAVFSKVLAIHTGASSAPMLPAHEIVSVCGLARRP